MHSSAFCVRIIITQKIIICSFAGVQVYEKVAAAFKSEKDVVVANVDADAHKELGSRYGEIITAPMLVPTTCFTLKVSFQLQMVKMLRSQMKCLLMLISESRRLFFWFSCDPNGGINILKCSDT